MLTMFYNLLFTLIVAFMLALFAVLATGSMLVGLAVAGATGLFMGVESAQRTLDEEESDGETK